MAIDKALYQAPKGIESLGDEESPLEIEIVNPDEVTIGKDGLEVVLEAGEEEGEEGFGDNLAEYISESELLRIGMDLIEEFDDDVMARKDWIQTYVDGLELLGLKIEERSEPWEGACGVYHPLLAEALVKFQAETMMSIFPAMGPVKTLIIGKETQEKKEAAERVQADMNFELTEVMTEYRPETERMLWGLGLAGNAFKKVYEDPILKRQVSLYVPAEDIVVPYGAPDLESAQRVTHVMRKTEHEMNRLMLSGFYRDIDLGTPSNSLDEVEKKIAEKLGFRATTDDRFKILEMQTNLDLAGFEHEDEEGQQTGMALPYVITIEKTSGKVLSIRRNWKEGDETYQKRKHIVHYGYIPGFGFYCFGLIHLIGAYAKSGTSIIRQLVDAGSLSNLPGGFKTRGLRVKGDDTPIAPGEFRDVDVPSGAMKDNIMPLPYKEPSQVLYSLLNTIVEEGRRFANTADLQASDMSANAPVGTTLAILERTLKVMSAVQARVHFSLKQELKLLKEIIADNAPGDYEYVPATGTKKARKSDYKTTDVIPVSDPNASTMAQKIVQYQAALQLAQSAPQYYNMPLLHRQMIEVLGLKDANKLIPLPEDMKPKDPVTENQDILMNKPTKAFAYQDHQAHITVHMSSMQDPKIQSLLQQNPQAQALQAAMMAHINEHLGFAYRVEIEKQLGMNLPPMNDETGDDINMDPEVEARLAPLLAQAATQLLQQNQQQAAQQQAQQQAQDPLVQLQQQELQIKQAEQQRKAQKDQADIQLRQQQQQIERERIQTQAQLQAQKDASQVRLAGEKNTTDIKMKAVQMSLDHLRSNKQLATTTGLDAFKHISAHAKDNNQHQQELMAEALKNQLDVKVQREENDKNRAIQKQQKAQNKKGK
jgi:hypothetical protein